MRFFALRALIEYRNYLQCTSIAPERTSASNASEAAATLQPFHLAFPVNSIETAKEFYGRHATLHLHTIGNTPALLRSKPPLTFSSQILTDSCWCFPCSKLGCQEGRSAATWVDYSLFGHQIVCHLVEGYNAASSHNAVDGDPVPVPHFGLALTQDQFHGLADRVKAAGIKFVLEPHLRFQGGVPDSLNTAFNAPLPSVICCAAHLEADNQKQ